MCLPPPAKVGADGPSKGSGLSVGAALKAHALASLWLLVIVEYFGCLVALLPLRLLSEGAYLYACAAFDFYAQAAVLCVPFSWCGTDVRAANWAACVRAKERGTSLFMANHGSRVDWLVGLLVGFADGPRVGVRFVAEITTALMPFVGWSRYLLGDVMLRRTFHRDAVNIKKNLDAFKRGSVDRLLFFAPEGAIADVGNGADALYVDACRSFMEARQRKPLAYLLTPRYKGLAAFLGHPAHKGRPAQSVTMAFLTPSSSAPIKIDEKTGAVSGGVLCTRKLDDPARSVPDLTTVFAGGLTIFATISDCDFPPTENLDDPGLRDALLDDYARKDGELAAFEKTGAYTAVGKAADWTKVPVDHVAMNATLLSWIALSVVAVAALRGVSLVAALAAHGRAWAYVCLLHGATHALGVMVSGHSRESLLGETVFKAVFELVRGSLDHGKAS